MFEFISGTLFSKGLDYVVIENSGIGYRLNASISTISALGEPGHQATAYTYLQVKEDGLALFGFASQEELSAFNMLIGVSGVGPKVGLSILSTLSPAQFSLAVASGDYKTISKSKGVGPKLAQRILLELKDKIKKNLLASGEDFIPDIEITDDAGIQGEAVSALIVLGYSPKEAQRAVSAVYEDGKSLEDSVKQALKKLMR
ncbi:MAG: Holliday junction branch migration protein RuvA [Clostridiales bacterium]|nr:Holliday junction branch migration protein RuvA [Clostridiales bacterium]